LVLASALLARHQGVSPIPVWKYVSSLEHTPRILLFKIFLGFTNLTMLFQDVSMFLAAGHGGIHFTAQYLRSDYQIWQGLLIPQAWSLGVELSFYLVAPLLLKLRSRWLMVVVISCLLTKVLVLHFLQLGDPWTYRFFPFEVGLFLSGALAYRYRKELERLIPRKFGPAPAYLLVILFSCTWSQNHLLGKIYPLLLAVILPAIFRATAQGRIDRMVGEVSYPFYLYHMFALTVVGAVGARIALPFNPVWTALVLTIVLSAAVLAIENRMVEPWRARFAERTD
jgi:peptidoglycan/LPS O-acetylase OafA/YrhL